MGTALEAGSGDGSGGGDDGVVGNVDASFRRFPWLFVMRRNNVGFLFSDGLPEDPGGVVAVVGFSWLIQDSPGAT